MKTIPTLARSASQAVLLAAGVLAFSVASAATMPHDQYTAAKDQISAAYKSDKAACDPMSGNAKDVCVEQAKGKEKVAKADLEYQYTGKDSDRVSAAKARADADYAVAKERCDDQSGNGKDVCVKQAKANHDKALADTKVSSKDADARKDAAATKRDADYSVAAEKCDALAGDAKGRCVDAAKARYGKS